jgi:hypothetical protein
MTNLPALQDYSKESINKAVVKEAITHPLSMYPGVMSVLCGVAGALFASPVVLGAAGVCFLVGAGSVVANYCFRYESVGQQYLVNLSKNMLEHRENLINSLKPDLTQCDPVDPERCRQGLEQFSLAKEKYLEITETLTHKLDGGELMYGRFMGLVEQVYLGLLDNLREIVEILQGIPDTEGDPKRLQKKLEQTEDENESRKLKALLKRFDLRNSQLKKVDELLARNEEAITELESTMVAVSSIKTDNKLADVDHEEAIQQLRGIAQRVTTSYENYKDPLKN